jgi:hypothetical protein
MRATALIGLAGGLLAAALAAGPLARVPHVQDEVAYFWQAQILAALRLEAPPPSLPVPHVFLITDPDRWFGAFPNGWPAVLALGVLLGVPWLVNPALHALVAWRSGELARRLAGDGAAIPTSLLVACSPQVVLLGASWMSHTVVLAAAVLATEGLLRWRDTPTGRDAARVGGLVGFVFCARPLDGAVLALALAFGARRHPTVLVGLGTAIVVGSLQFAQNAHYTGELLRWPVDRRFAELAAGSGRPADCNALGFGPDHGCDPSHPGYTLADAWVNASFNLRRWADLLGLPVLLLQGLALRSRPRVVLASVGSTLAVVGAHALYWYGGTCYGARFYHLAVLGPLVAVGVGAAALPRMPRVALLLGLVALDAAKLRAVLPELDGYWGTDGRVMELAARWSEGPAIVLVEAVPDAWWTPLPLTGPAGGDLRTLASQLLMPANSPFGDDLTFLVDTPRARQAAARDGRPVWLAKMGRRTIEVGGRP